MSVVVSVVLFIVAAYHIFSPEAAQKISRVRLVAVFAPLAPLRGQMEPLLPAFADCCHHEEIEQAFHSEELAAKKRRRRKRLYIGQRILPDFKFTRSEIDQQSVFNS